MTEASLQVSHPVRVEIDRPERVSRWLVLVKWIFILPHALILSVLGTVGFVCTVLSFVFVVVAGRDSHPLWAFTVGLQRWSLRASAYTYLMVDQYPGFTLKERTEDRVRLRVAFPGTGVARWRPLVQPILVIPMFVVNFLLHIACALLSFPALFAILFKCRLPDWLWRFNENALTMRVRCNLYNCWAVTEYPPLRWGTEKSINTALATETASVDTVAAE